MFSFFKHNKLSTTESVDIIENMLYENLRPLGFKKFGRSLHRFVETDISQVVTFQNGCPQKGILGVMWVRIGIRVPESADMEFILTSPLKKYYPAEACNMCADLGKLMHTDKKDISYNLKKNPQKIGKEVAEKIEKYAMPVFELMNSRDSILAHRAEYPCFGNNHLILLEEAMIFGRRGKIPEATQRLNAYYQKVYNEYIFNLEYGEQVYLRKGCSITAYNTRLGRLETITADKDGYVTLYTNGPKGHLEYIEKLAQKLEIPLMTHFAVSNIKENN